MSLLVLHVALIGFLNSTPCDARIGESDAHRGEVTALLPGTWRVVEIIDGPASDTVSEEAIKKLAVQVTANRLVLTGGEEKKEYAIVGIDPTQRPTAIDLRDVTRGRTYRGIYEQEGKRLRICVQFWIKGDATRSVRPQSFQEAHRGNVLGPRLFLLEQK